MLIHAKREGLRAQVLVGSCEIRGLSNVDEKAEMEFPRIPSEFLAAILKMSRSACVDRGEPIEALFHLRYVPDENRWRLDIPPQERTAISVIPTEDGEGSSYQLALVEVHSHHQMEPDFSPTDDDEEQGFRIYGVIGNIFTTPRFRVRVGVYGNFLELPAEQFFEMPGEVTDANDWIRSDEETATATVGL